MQLTLQDNGSEAEEEDDAADFTEAGYKLRDELLPPVLVPEDSQSMSSLKKAKTLQRKFDEQIQSLTKNKSLTAILDRSVTDVIPCANEHRSHCRRILEILITDLNLNSRVIEKNRGSCVAFKIVAASLPSDIAGTPVPPRSQLAFSPGMLEVNMYCSLVW